MNEEDLKADLDANLIAEAGFCWHLYPNRPAYELSDFIRDLELFVGGPVQDDQVLITWKRVLGTTDNVEGLTAEALSELDKKIGRGSRVQRNVWKSMSQAWTYAISSRKREFLVEEGPNCWVRSTGSSLDFLLRKSIGWLQFAARTGAQSKNRFDIPFSEQVGGDWRELYTLPHKGSLFDDADDE